MIKKTLCFCIVFFIIIFVFESCNSISKNTARQEEMDFNLRQYNRILGGAYDSLFILYDSISDWPSTPMSIFYFHDYEDRTCIDYDLRFLFYDIYENKRIHPYIKQKHYIKALSFQEKKIPFSTYEMDYEILIQIDKDTFQYRYITPKNFDKFSDLGGIDIEPRFFWDIYKDEPDACDFIATHMLKKGFLHNQYTRPTYFYWLNNVIEKHNTPTSKELFCKAYEYLSLANPKTKVEEEVFEKLKTYNCPQVEEIIMRFKTRWEREKATRK